MFRFNNKINVFKIIYNRTSAEENKFFLDIGILRIINFLIVYKISVF